MNNDIVADKIIEEAIIILYSGYFRLRKGERYQEEYDSMGTLMDMLMKDRQALREKYKINI